MKAGRYLKNCFRKTIKKNILLRQGDDANKKVILILEK